MAKQSKNNLAFINIKQLQKIRLIKDKATKIPEGCYYSIKKWGSDVISVNWKYIFEIWKIQNEDTHGIVPIEKQEEKLQKKLLIEAKWIQDQHMESRARIGTTF